MESISETPAKRRKTESGFVSKAYDSQDDSGDEVFDAFETVDTVPLPGRSILTESPWPSTQQVTQPTQIIPKCSPDLNRQQNPPSVQVGVSSPLAPASHQTKPTFLANSIAPAGTAFRPPLGVVKPQASPLKKRSVVDMSDDDDDNDDDDGPRYEGDSSDEESQLHRADIRPSSFATGQRNDQDPSVDRFREITSSATYKPDVHDQSGNKKLQLKSSDLLANAYSGIHTNLTSKNHQSGPSKALSGPVKPAKDIPIDSISDIQVRQKIRQMLTIFPVKSVLECRDALMKKRYNYQDALDYLFDLEERNIVIDLTASEDAKSQTSIAKLDISTKKPSAKQQLKEPVKTIHQKWTSTQLRAEHLVSLPREETLKLEKPRRRLIQGRKATSPVNVARTKSPTISPTPARASFTGSDSGFSDAPDDENDESKVLNFFNNCSTPDLVDIAAISEDIAKLFASKRPFPSLKFVREVCEATTIKKGKTKQPKRIGEKIVDKVLEMWKGYGAIDSLIERCEQLAKPLTEAMTRWGVNVSDAANKNGELEILDIDRTDTSSRDSGIGTPSSRSVSIERDIEHKVLRTNAAQRQRLFGQPSNMVEGVSLKDYQIVGFNWIYLLFQHRLSGILADDMGLGKTCQVIAFLAHLLQQGISGPHLVIVPSSTLENWLREFSVFCSQLRVVPYYGTQNERPEIREQITAERASINVVVTTYAVAKMKDDNKFLRKKLLPVCCIYDEGHMLRNSKAAGYEAYMRIQAEFRLLLTGTPLQNNLSELCSLLGFILPSLFQEHMEDLSAIFSHKARTTDNNESHAALLSTQRIAKAKSMMSPFVLRRKKHQVLKYLPSKTKRVEFCKLSQSQQQIYELEKEKAVKILARRSAGEATSNESTNIMMSLRKASIHSLLFRRLYDDALLRKMSKACTKEEEFHESNVDLVVEDMEVMDDIELHLFCERWPNTMSTYALSKQDWMDSGKVDALTVLLRQYKKDGDRVLIFSQFVMVLNILELVMETLDMRFFRLDGSTKVEERQAMIDEFYQDPDITVFLLSTKAGGAGINLACANKVIIFDSSFNPQDDIQAENRAHRVGQTRDVEVVRMITRGTIEEQIHALGQTKLALDDRIAGVADEQAVEKVEDRGIHVVEEMLRLEM